MSLLSEFRAMRATRVQERDALQARIDEHTAQVERLLAQNAADTEAREGIAADVAYLDQQIATLSEHEEPTPAPDAPTPTESRRQAEQMVRDRHEVEESLRRGRQKSKPDPVKAARKAAKRAAEEAAAAAKPKRAGRVTDPLAVRHLDAERTINAATGIKRPRHDDPNTPLIDLSKVSKRELEHADLVALILEDGAQSKHEIATAMLELVSSSTIKNTGPMASKAVGILRAQKRAIPTGEKKAARPGGPRVSAVWKLAVHATPPELASAGLGTDEDNYAGTTTRWPTAETTPGLGRVTVESSGFEQGKGR